MPTAVEYATPTTPLEVVTGTSALASTETVLATLTAWHPLADAYVDAITSPLFDGATFRIYGVVGGNRLLLATRTYAGYAPGAGARIFEAVPIPLGMTVELAAVSIHGTTPPVQVAIVGWDINAQTTNAADAVAVVTTLSPGGETPLASLPWHPAVALAVTGSPQAEGSTFRIRAVLPGFATSPQVAEGPYLDEIGAMTAQALGGAASWVVTGQAGTTSTGAIQVSAQGTSPGGSAGASSGLFPDGSLANPSIAFTNEPGLGFFRAGDHALGTAVEDNLVNEFGDFTITNLDPTNPAVVRYANRLFPLPINGVNETAAFYVRIDPAVDHQTSGLYLEVTSNQLDTFGGAIKGIHAGAGDWGYVAGVAPDGRGWEVARFAYGGGSNYISTYQTSLASGTIGNPAYEALFCSTSAPGAPAIPGNVLPQYGLFYANQASGKAFVARKFGDGNVANGVPMFVLYENDLATIRFCVNNDGELRIESLNATALVQTRNSPPLRTLGAKYVDGPGNVQSGAYFQYAFDAPGNPSGGNGLRCYVGELGGEFLSFIARSTGLDLQTNGITSCASLFNFTAALTLGTNGRTELTLDDALLTGLGTTAAKLTVDNSSGINNAAVTLGAADSGGAGFRVLRVPN